ncbi:ATP-binding cassette domain-containing protein [Clostridium sp. OM05-6BH]|jgi:ABC-2 type transport system ATP-binding protein|uniref:ATP-binding cassette domain-containing protein n=1 Tax=unclassified Clostridium TaxID=2614128 RepID=UPI000E509EB4|nr:MULTISPECIES: ATP-binding cassette domain-containing protein [unclassified Clostridium]RHV15920.1 ATP-binding cassette domain-containing protein [Clostridium sp. OM05-9BH]RHV20130.1 ATP-binding cassette domain-containing protein [Clostridium sp. OM05-6BH]
MDYIRLKDVYKTMKGTQVLKGVNLMVEQGDIVGIRGINGSGKTMVLRAIAGLIRVDGSVEIGGKKMEPGECPKDIGVLVEMPGFLPEFTGKKNLQLLGMLQEGVTEEDIEEAMNAVGLDPKDRRHYKKYSLGMKERLGIAQAILKKPKLILLDEPTNGIDSDGIQMLEELLRHLKEAGSTIVVTSHDRDFLDAVTSQCYEMKEGSLR